MPRQSFNDFLNEPGPSNHRGRGGAHGSGRGRGRGRAVSNIGDDTQGSNYRSSPRRGGGRAADYSNVPFNYDRINSQGYVQLEGFSVNPFGPATTTSGTATPRGRGRGGTGSRSSRGRENQDNNGTSGRGRGNFSGTGNRLGGTDSPDTPSGAATPVTGLGFAGRGLRDRDRERGSSGMNTTGNNSTSSKSTLRSTVGKDGVTWGGRGAPLFVKAGELFKDGEVDVIKMDENHNLRVESLPLSDPSAPQMLDLNDDHEVEFIDDDVFQRLVKSDAAALPTSSQVDSEIRKLDSKFTAQLDLHREEEERSISQDPPPEKLVVGNDMIEIDTSAALQVTTATSDEVVPGIPQEQPESAVTATDPAPLFFIDTAPNEVSTAVPLYDSTNTQPLGVAKDAPSSDEEEIVFKPRTYRDPEPISVQSFQATTSIDPTAEFVIPPPDPEAISRAYVDPRATKPSRKDKKALKREKRSRNKKGKKSNNKPKINNKLRAQAMDGSDIEWGSDGPPQGIFNAEGLEIDSETEGDGEEDEAVLRDYLAGTMLNAAEEGDEELGSDEADEAIRLDLSRNGVVEQREVEREERSGSNNEGDLILDELTGDPSSDEDDDHLEEDVANEQWESVSDSDESNESAKIDRQLALALAEDDWDEEDSDLDELFKGRGGWENETEWFIRNMEDALEDAGSLRDRKSRNKLFNAIQNGSFDDYDLPTEPAKKSKNKHVPTQLQAQWEKDRQAKAAKKRQRALDRLAAKLDPFAVSTNKFVSKGKVKGKGKARDRDMAQAASMAHLIPASAAEVADIFDISSDEEIPSHLLRKGRKALLPELSEGLFERIDESIRQFLDDEGRQALTLPPMDKEGRKKVHMLAECYSLKSKSRGSGKNRFTVLIKTSRSGMLIDEAKISRLVAASSQSGGFFYKAMYTKSDGSSKGKKGGSGGPSRGTGSSARAREGDQVGEGAEKIGMDNIGHRLLSKMGWAEGDKIGKTGGLDAPIVAIVKNTKSGLGA